MKRPLRLKASEAKHEAFYQDINTVLAKYLGDLDAIEMLAICANMVGKMVAMQDHRKYTPEQVMNLVASNLMEGNNQAIAELTGPSAGRA